nr:dna-directed rna polymerase i subunit 2 [Quercus suber]
MADAGLSILFDSIKPVQIHDSFSNRTLKISFENPKLFPPMKDRSSSSSSSALSSSKSTFREFLYPYECRQFKSSYTGALMAEVCFQYDDGPVIRERFNFGQFPIMLKPKRNVKPRPTPAPEDLEALRELFRHQIESFDYMADAGLSILFDSIKPVQIHDSFSNRTLKISFENPKLFPPMKDRQFKSSYTGALMAEVCFQYDDGPVIRERFNFGQFPIMLKGIWRERNAWTLEGYERLVHDLNLSFLKTLFVWIHASGLFECQSIVI